MAKATASDSNGASTKMFSENTVAVLLMALGCVSIPVAQYDIMSALDGEKTANSFQHQFRSVLKKAKDLKARVDNGETFTPVNPPPKRSAATAFGGSMTTPPDTPKKPKTGPKAAPKARAKATPTKGKKSVDKLPSPSSNSEECVVKLEEALDSNDGDEF